MYFIGYLTFSYKQNGVVNHQHVDVYYDELKEVKLYRMLMNGQIRIVQKHQLNFKPNVIINTFPLHGSGLECPMFMITSDINKALQSGVELQNVFNSVSDMRNHIDEWFGQNTIAKMKLQFEHQVHNAMNNKFDMLHATLVSLQRQVECQEKEIALLKSELHELSKPRNVEVSCCDLLSLDDENKAVECNPNTTNKTPVFIEY